MNGWFGFNDVIIFPSRVMGLHLSFSNLILLLPNLLKFLDLLGLRREGSLSILTKQIFCFVYFAINHQNLIDVIQGLIRL